MTPGDALLATLRRAALHGWVVALTCPDGIRRAFRARLDGDAVVLDLVDADALDRGTRRR